MHQEKQVFPFSIFNFSVRTRKISSNWSTIGDRKIRFRKISSNWSTIGDQMSPNWSTIGRGFRKISPTRSIIGVRKIQLREQSFYLGKISGNPITQYTLLEIFLSIFPKRYFSLSFFSGTLFLPRSELSRTWFCSWTLEIIFAYSWLERNWTFALSVGYFPLGQYFPERSRKLYSSWPLRVIPDDLCICPIGPQSDIPKTL